MLYRLKIQESLCRDIGLLEALVTQELGAQTRGEQALELDENLLFLGGFQTDLGDQQPMFNQSFIKSVGLFKFCFITDVLDIEPDPIGRFRKTEINVRARYRLKNVRIGYDLFYR